MSTWQSFLSPKALAWSHTSGKLKPARTYTWNCTSVGMLWRCLYFTRSDLILNEIVKGAVEGGTLLQASDEEMESLVTNFRSDVAKMLPPVGKAVVLGDSSRRKELFEILKDMDNKVIGPYFRGEKGEVAHLLSLYFYGDSAMNSDLTRIVPT